MGEFNASSPPWKKMVLTKSDSNKWTSNIKSDMSESTSASHTSGFSIDYADIKKEIDDVNNDSYRHIQHIMEPELTIVQESEMSESSASHTSGLSTDNPFGDVKTEIDGPNDSFHHMVEPELSMVEEEDPLQVDGRKRRRRGSLPKEETSEERAARLAKMSAYAAQRLANETPKQRATRLKRMSEYAAKRLAQETSEQRAKRLSRMSAYAAKRLAKESPEQRQARLARMSEYAARRQAMKKLASTGITHVRLEPTTNSIPNRDPTGLPNQS